MIKKQINWAVRVQKYGAPGGIDPSEMLKGQYSVADGWELVSTHVAMSGVDGVSVVMLFAQYEYVYDAPVDPAYDPTPIGATGEAPKHRGRPKKVAEEVAG